MEGYNPFQVLDGKKANIPYFYFDKSSGDHQSWLLFFPWSNLNFANSSTGFRLTARQQDNSERMQRLLMVRVERILNGVYDGIN